MHTAMQIAQYIIDVCTRQGKPITNLQLQKILYYVQLNFYRRFDELAFDDTIQAWEYGPVVPPVYYYYSSYGGAKICNLYDGVQQAFSKAEEELIAVIIDACTSIPVWELVKKSHKANTPWARVYNGNRVNIPINYIMEYAKG